MTTINEIINILKIHKNDVKLNLYKFLETYKHTSINKREEFSNPDNQPKVEIKYINNSEFININYFEYSHSSATININIVSDIKLIDKSSGNEISSVAGISLPELKTHKNYSLISDGEVNCSSLPIKFNNITPFNELKNLGVVSGDYNPDETYHISLSYPIRSNMYDSQKLYESIDTIMNIKMISSMLSALTKETTSYTPEQIQILKEHCLTKSLNVSIPAPTLNIDLDEAVQNNKLQVKKVNKVKIGTLSILNSDKLRSANEMFARYYETSTDKKPKFNIILEDIPFTAKILSARSKETTSDIIQKELMDAFIGIKSSDRFEQLCQKLNCNELSNSIVKLKNSDLTDIIENCKLKFKQYENQLWESEICPLILESAFMGNVPTNLNAIKMTKEELILNHPFISLSKDEQSSTFYVINDLIISISNENKYM